MNVFKKDMDYIIKTQIKRLEVKHILSAVKNTLDEIRSPTAGKLNSSNKI